MPLSEAIERLKQEFLGEAEETLAAFRADLLLLGETPAATFPDFQLVDRVFRTAHSLKGVLGMFGFDEMARVSHALESVLDRIRGRAMLPNRALVDLLLEGNETLHGLLSRATMSTGEPDRCADSLVQRIDELLRGHSGAPGAPPAPDDPLLLALAQVSRGEAAALRSAYESGESICVVEVREAGARSRVFYDVIQAVRAWGVIHGFVEAPLVDPSQLPALRILASGKAGFFALAKAVGPLGGDVLPCEAERIFQSAPEPQPSLALPDAGATRGAPVEAASPTLRVRLERIDRLLASLAELLRAKMSLDAAVAHSSAAPLDRMRRTEMMQSLRGLARKIAGLQEEILEVRLVAMAHFVPQLERVVWSAAKECGKRARLAASGLDVEVDKEIVDALLPALVHLARNAVDHGLEDEAARAARGKDPVGTIRIQARSNGRVATVEVSDDGAGIDLANVTAVARERGLFSREGDPSREEILDVLFHPGFTTRRQATSVSGRGVGLDAVRDALSNLGGGLEVETGENGTLFRLRVPTTLAILPGLLVRAGDQTFVLPMASLTQVIKIRPSQVEKREEGEMVRIDGRELPAIDLASVLGLPDVDRRGGIALLLSCAGRSAVLFVDAVGARRDVVTQGLGFVQSEIPGVVGSTELGDGQTLLLLDPAALFDAGRRNIQGATA